ncbi:40S ribosomal protein S27-like isoform X2 [Rhinatrema bivittatum]|nr:40S ribosomal protein S27-like isoform X2 [Rhinatrema bivittatum]
MGREEGVEGMAVSRAGSPCSRARESLPGSTIINPRCSSRAVAEVNRGGPEQQIGSLRVRRKMPLAQDFLHPLLDRERQRHKKKRLVQSPNSYFMDVKCPGCYKITTVFSHAQSVVLCVGCSTILCQPTGGKCRLTEGCSFRRKPH